MARFIAAQHMFFVATAPLDPTGHVNLSPKGLKSFRVIDPKTVAYLDLTGSGIETVSHLRENGRIVICFARSMARRRSCGCTVAARQSSLAILGFRAPQCGTFVGTLDKYQY